jgi:hypothetical protein
LADKRLRAALVANPDQNFLEVAPGQVIQRRLQADPSCRMLLVDHKAGARKPEANGRLSQKAIGQRVGEQGRTGAKSAVRHHGIVKVNIRAEAAIDGGGDNTDVAFFGPSGQSRVLQREGNGRHSQPRVPVQPPEIGIRLVKNVGRFDFG